MHTDDKPIQISPLERVLIRFRNMLAWSDYQMMLTRKKYPGLFDEQPSGYRDDAKQENP